MIWEILLSSLLAAIAYKSIKRVIDAQSSQDRNMSPTGYLRELGKPESLLHILFKTSDFLISNNIVIKSKVHMDNYKVEEALHIIARQHPLLQAAIREVQSANGKQFHFIKMSSFKVIYQQSNKLAAEPSHWHDVMTKDVLQPMNDEDGPLWRCCRLKECTDSRSKKITNCFVFTFHHSIIDGISMTLLYENFLLILHKLHIKESISEVSYDLPPPAETLFADKLRREWWTRMAINVSTNLRKIGSYSSKSQKIDAYFNKYPVVSNEYPDVQQEVGAIFTSFSKAETKKLLHACKEHGCSVNGAITASANMAMAEILQNGQVTEAQLIPSKYLINCKRNANLKKNRTADDLGLYSVVAKLDCCIPSYDLQSFCHVFWRIANSITTDVHKAIKNHIHVYLLKGLQSLSVSHIETEIKKRMGEHPSGRIGDSLFIISNIGRFDEHSNDDCLFRIEEFFFVASGHKFEHLFQVFCVTVNGMLCLSLVYYPHVSVKRQAEDFNSRIVQNLKRAFNTSR